MDENGTADERSRSSSPVHEDDKNNTDCDELSSGSSSVGTPSPSQDSAARSPSPQAPKMTSYSVGDHCFFETSASGPYQIRRLDEFVKNGSSVDAKVLIYSRKSDLPFSVQKEISGFVDGDLDDSYVPLAELIARRDAPDARSLRRQVEHFTASRETFLNKDDMGPVMETLPTSLIRGKCTVLHHLEGTPKRHYTEMENAFFYHRAWYIPTDLQTGEIVVDREKQINYDTTGSHQATIPGLLSPSDRSVYSLSPSRATPLWTPHLIPDSAVASFVQAAVAVGLMARCVSSAAANGECLSVRENTDTVARLAGMDGTLQAAHDLLHQCDYSVVRAMDGLVGQGLWSKRSLLETFDETDMSFFRIGLHESARDIKKIHEDWLPWRTFADIVGFYYLFKSSSYYKAFRSSKAGAKQENGIVTCVSLPAYDSRSCLLRHVPDEQICYGCYETSDVWYAWSGLARSRRQVRAVCGSCWSFWKRYGCLKHPWRSPPTPFRKKLKPSAPTAPARGPTTVDSHPCFSPKPTAASTGKQLLLTHRSPQLTPQSTPKWTEDVWEVEKSQADEEEFQFAAGDEWRLARRVATESLYDPKQLARYPLLACHDMDQTETYFRGCPGLVVDYYRKRKSRKKAEINDVISRVSDTRKATPVANVLDEGFS